MVPHWAEIYSIVRYVIADKFEVTCTIKADLSKLCQPSFIRAHNGKLFWRIDFDVEIMLGLTELQARIKWVEDVCCNINHDFIASTDESRLLKGKTK